MPTPQSPTVRELYDLLMAQIEPDLVSDVVPHLPELYAGEAPERTRERMARYARALDAFRAAAMALSRVWAVDLREALRILKERGEGKGPEANVIEAIGIVLAQP